MEQEKLNGKPSEGLKEINDEELDQVTGGDGFMFDEKYCYMCKKCGWQKIAYTHAKPDKCENCGSKELDKDKSNSCLINNCPF